ncbi:YARHG domain-containing protein [Rhodoblastus acidophilus]|uniref:YARHG domain-containing protein n=1 Tax=Candidatus Rhodoblastus alkanivorans TaxID=2954117 RepID=A0ABS9Z4M8_9HYPH|nr:YARHG domain-containing protein [Candidatus Rhodoblastus alkanivorans]MCI4682142.1 YARHG domain-containing protein [Candidatus Rhodoblastus alkanivorans]MDI4639444.1 YARHG domain-containing protein [Rhodoblastus acidophilus]
MFGCTDRNFFRAQDLYDGPNCEFLYVMRNSIYKEHGYCFTTPRAIRTFGNAGCRYDDVRDVPLNRFERANVPTIQAVERGKGCSR